MTQQINSAFIQQLNQGELINFHGQFSSAAIDSRQIKPGMAFIALTGEHTDGHRFVSEAVQRGAALAIVSKEWARHHPQKCAGLPLWIVEDPLQALQNLAHQWRRQFQIPLIGITGTNGKTTTRAMAAAILRKKFKVHATHGNFNNEIGVPLTLLALNPAHQISVMEFGANHFGEIQHLCELAEPTAGLITNIGHGHLEFFNTLEGVAQAKGELFQSLPQDGVAFVNQSDGYIANMSLSSQSFTYGFEPNGVELKGAVKQINPKGCPVLMVNDTVEIQLQVAGITAAYNALAATAVGYHYGIPLMEIKTALENFQSVDKRLRIIPGPCTIIDDTYNANPDSTKASLETLTLMHTSGKRIFVFGDMLELGETTNLYHAQIGELVFKKQIDVFYTYGKLAHKASQQAQSLGMQSVFHFERKAQLIDELKRQLNPSDLILIKGSRDCRMEEITKGIVG